MDSLLTGLKPARRDIITAGIVKTSKYSDPLPVGTPNIAVAGNIPAIAEYENKYTLGREQLNNAHKEFIATHASDNGSCKSALIQSQKSLSEIIEKGPYLPGEVVKLMSSISDELHTLGIKNDLKEVVPDVVKSSYSNVSDDLVNLTSKLHSDSIKGASSKEEVKVGSGSGDTDDII